MRRRPAPITSSGRRWALVLAILALVGASRAKAAVEVRLRSGRVLSATSAERVGDLVVVQTAGSTLRIPSKDVTSIVAVAAPAHAGGLNLPPVEPATTPEPAQADRRGPVTATPSGTTSTQLRPGLSEGQLRAMLVDQPANGAARLALASILSKSGRLTEALSQLALVPSDAPAPQLVERALASASILTHLDRPADALAALDAAPRTASADPRLAAARESIAADERAGGDALVSTHFRVHVQGGMSRFDAAPLLDELERAHALIATALGSAPREPIIVLLYPGDEFWEATGQGSNVGGLFDGKIRVPAGRVSPPSPRLTEVLRHEVAHAFVHVLAGGRAPTAWHEGVAEHFEGDDISAAQRALAAVAHDPSRWPPAMTHEVAHARMEWFLGRYGMAALTDILRRMAVSGVDVATRAVTGLTEAELDEAWRRALAERAR